MKNLKDTALCLQSLKRCTSGMILEYSLYRLHCKDSYCYAIRVRSGEETRTRCFGRDMKVAESAFSAVVRNTVTPCTLDYIVEDMMGGRDKRRK